METKTLAFDVRDIEQFKEFFPDFKSGKMSGRELGSRLLELLHNQATSPATSSIQVNEDDFKQSQHDFLQAKDLLDDEAFRFSGEMLSFGIDVAVIGK